MRGAVNILITKALITRAVRSFPEIHLNIICRCSTAAGRKHFYVFFILYDLTKTRTSRYYLTTLYATTEVTVGSEFVAFIH